MCLWYKIYRCVIEELERGLEVLNGSRGGTTRQINKSVDPLARCDGKRDGDK